jgi:hypothetical protein
MALLAGHSDMRARQREVTEVVIERRWRPTIRGMTGRAIRPKAAFMRVVGMMTGVTILQRPRKIAESARIEMALTTGKIGVFACQWERKGIVIEALAETIHTIVTIEAGRAK